MIRPQEAMALIARSGEGLLHRTRNLALSSLIEFTKNIWCGLLRIGAEWCGLLRNGAEMAGAGLRFNRELVRISAEIAGAMQAVRGRKMGRRLRVLGGNEV
jgi:hypothetical protein